jgi:hypothetical protein
VVDRLIGVPTLTDLRHAARLECLHEEEERLLEPAERWPCLDLHHLSSPLIRADGFFLRHRHLASTPTNLVLPLTEIGIAENVRER